MSERDIGQEILEGLQEIKAFKAGNLVSLEILDASQRVERPTQIEYQLVPVPDRLGGS